MSDRNPSQIQADGDPGSTSIDIWPLLLALADLRRHGAWPDRATGFCLSTAGDLLTTPPTDPRARLTWGTAGLAAAPSEHADTQDLIDLYSPLFPAISADPLVVAHLGQSIDARIATLSGDSCFVTGPENIVHLHRMRALCDAVIVGAGTVDTDDPRLTTRLVQGPHPVRVVIDPERRLSTELGVFNDGKAFTLRVCAEDRVTPDDEAAVIGLPRRDHGLCLPTLISTLQHRGLRNLFVEGGGITVTRWMTAGLLNRLHVTVAPVFIGDGRASFGLPPASVMASCLRPDFRVFRLGEDLLWDFDLTADHPQGSKPASQSEGPRRVR